jgi:hypothetical protein
MKKAYDRRDTDLERGRMEIVGRLFFGGGQTLQDQYDRPLSHTDIDRLIGCIQNKDRSIHEKYLTD